MGTSRIPLSAAQKLVKEYSIRQLILVAWDGKEIHVLTDGDTDHDADQAADGGNLVKRALGWPDQLCNAVSARTLQLKARVKQLEAQVKSLQQELNRASHG